MNVEAVWADGDADEVESLRPDRSAQTLRLDSLGGVCGVCRVTASEPCAHLDRNQKAAIIGQDVYLAPAHPDVGGKDRDAPFDQVPTGEALAESADLAPIQI